MRHPLFRSAFLILLFIGVLHAFAVSFYIYWSVWWFDILMHFLGGFWVGLIALWTYDMRGIRERIGPGKMLSVALLTALVVGGGWELYEYATGRTYAINAYAEDLALDLSMDVLGALVSVLYAGRVYRKVGRGEHGE